MRRGLMVAGLVLGVGLGLTAATVIAKEPEEGVKVGRPSILRKLVSAEKIEQTSRQQFVQLKNQAQGKNALMPAAHPEAQRLRRIASHLLPFAPKWNERAKDWKWEVVLIKSGNINAFCMPGGKIAFFTGIIDKLQLTDDEVAMVMGHEIAHALREHARARAAKSTITNVGGRVIGALIFGQAGEMIGAQGASLLTLKFSRDDEKDADLVGMELAARAGYNPRAGITLWEKMSRAAKGAPPQWMSTHPSGETRIDLIKKNLDSVMPLYEKAKANRPAADTTTVPSRRSAPRSSTAGSSNPPSATVPGASPPPPQPGASPLPLPGQPPKN